MSGIQTHNLVVIGTDYTGSCKSNNHTITTKMAPYYDVRSTLKKDEQKTPINTYLNKPLKNYIFIEM